jgi:hypothetical protein
MMAELALYAIAYVGSELMVEAEDRASVAQASGDC